ncbi:MAG: 50S ribosomal protein L31e [Candidatus Bathyarchaeia archaeon]
MRTEGEKGNIEEEKIEKIEETTEKTEAKGEIKEVKPSAKEEIAEEEIVEERFYTIPLGKAWIVPPNRRASKAIKIIRDFIIRHMKLETGRESEEEGEEPRRVIISNEVNEKIWSRSIEKPPRKIRVRATKDKEGNVTVHLAEGD